MIQDCIDKHLYHLLTGDEAERAFPAAAVVKHLRYVLFVDERIVEKIFRKFVLRDDPGGEAQ